MNDIYQQFTYSTTPWWSEWEVIGIVPSHLLNKSIDGPPNNCKLQMEIAITVDVHLWKRPRIETKFYDMISWKMTGWKYWKESFLYTWQV